VAIGPNPKRVLLIPYPSSSVARATIILNAKIESGILLVRGPAMAIEFRSDLKGIWHWCSDCRYWPANSFDILNTQKLPPDFKRCPECTVLAPRWIHSAVRITFTIPASESPVSTRKLGHRRSDRRPKSANQTIHYKVQSLKTSN